MNQDERTIPLWIRVGGAVLFATMGAGVWFLPLDGITPHWLSIGVLWVFRPLCSVLNVVAAWHQLTTDRYDDD